MATKHVSARPHVVIVGAGFGGLTPAQSLRKSPVKVTVIDRTNHHLFQPLLYQVAIAGLSPADIAVPIRSILRTQANASVILAEAIGVDYDAQTVQITDGSQQELIRYDYLVLATGGRTTYFGHDDWAKYAPGLKDLDDAVEIRRRVLLAFEAAEREEHPQRRRELLTFVVVGGGPTGVELAGAIAELAKYVLGRDFSTINPKAAEIILVEGGSEILTSFAPSLSANARQQLEGLGVKIRLGTQVTKIDSSGVHLGDQHIPAATVIWGAGVVATSFTGRLGVPMDRAGRVIVSANLTVANHKNVFAIGDMARFESNGKPLPGTSPVAMQMGRTVARNIGHDLAGKSMEEFKFVDKGSMATIGRKAAVAQIGKMRLTGFSAWIAWLMLHLFFLIGFRNRMVVLINWAWSYFSYQRGARLITGRVLNITQRTSEDENAPATSELRGDYVTK